MRLSVAILLVVHGLIHLIGVARAFGLAAMPRLTQSIPPAMGALWLTALLLFVAGAGALFLWPRWWWAPAVLGVIASSAAILPSWSDAKFGMLVNALVLIAALFGYLAWGPRSLRAAYEREVAAGLARAAPQPVITGADLAPLPPPVQRYLRGAGVVGQPRVQNMRVTMRGRIRNGPSDPWMPLEVEQYSFFGPPSPSRLFYMRASRGGVPIQGLHRYVGTEATMRVKAAALATVAAAGGPAMLRSETVTMFNDMCLLAPATLIDPAVRWEGVDGNVVRAAFTNAGETIRASLVFNDTGELVNFWSDDRGRAESGGNIVTTLRWSTPIGDYRSFGPARLASRGNARWHDATGEYAYIELEFTSVTYNVAP